MSEHYICFAPTDPRFIPTKAAQAAGVALLRAAWPQVRGITTEVDDDVVFRDCGENFESVRCPHCDAALDLDEWQSLMDADSSDEGGFRLDSVPMSCCGQPSTLNDLKYEWPQAFSRFAVVAADPGEKVAADVLAKLESALGCGLRVIYQMY